jgi:pimeloyl-ACP methyl ester carboxylesterase
VNTQRTHHVTTTDDVTIGGTVHGHGRQLVFVHGVMGDGDIDWQPLLGYLTSRYTCHLPSLRGRGLSGDHPDHSTGRRVDDVLAYVDSLGEPTGLVGWSAGGTIALGVAAKSAAVDAVAVYEPALPPEVWPAEQRRVVGETVARVSQLADDGDMTAAARAFAGFVFHDEELAELEEAGYVEAVGSYVPALLHDAQQGSRPGDPSLADPQLLGRISAPVLLLHGPDTDNPLFITCVRYTTEHITSATVQEIRGAGHAAPLTHPEALAAALTGFISPARQPA